MLMVGSCHVVIYWDHHFSLESESIARRATRRRGLLAGRCKPQVARLLAALEGERFIVPPELSVVVKLSGFPAARGVLALAALFETGDRHGRVDRRPLTDEIAHAQTPASTPPSGLAGLLEKL